ncbi:MAG: TSCPD domain-containing protein [Methanobacteriota archaeon]|nr:MAG: TSCPD domain-containing protein [Euryarchaeota archaeon]
MKKIDGKIVGFEVVKEEEKKATENNVQAIAPLLERDEVLEGATYKIKVPNSEHAMYITINDVVINKGMPDEHRRPFEIFINSKNMEHFMWIIALTRVISAIFRKGGDVAFLVEELKAVFDPRGGHFKKGGKFMPSLVAEIGEVIEQHLVRIGMLKKEQPNEIIQKKIDEIKANGGLESISNREQCGKCGALAVILMDGCRTCLECGDSKCG